MQKGWICFNLKWQSMIYNMPEIFINIWPTSETKEEPMKYYMVEGLVGVELLKTIVVQGVHVEEQ